jgi:nitrite reductase/ring-hydroxylating ferredoxin subunit
VPRVRLRKEVSEPVDVGPASEVPDGGLTAFEVNGAKIAVARLGTEHYAFDDTCTHMQCSLSTGDLDGHHVVCPCHAGTFDVRDGTVVSGPPPAPVRTYRVRVTGDRLQIEV